MSLLTNVEVSKFSAYSSAISSAIITANSVLIEEVKVMRGRFKPEALGQRLDSLIEHFTRVYHKHGLKVVDEAVRTDKIVSTQADEGPTSNGNGNTPPLGSMPDIPPLQ